VRSAERVLIFRQKGEQISSKQYIDKKKDNEFAEFFCLCVVVTREIACEILD